MVQKQDKSTALPGVFPTLAAGFDLTTRYLWLMAIPALLDLFLWIGPRLSFRALVERLIAQMPAEALVVDPRPLLEEFAPRLNHFIYLSVTYLGVPTLMSGLSPEKTPIAPAILDGGGWAGWIGYLLLFTLAGLLLAALYYNLIAYAMRRSMADGAVAEAARGQGRQARQASTGEGASPGASNLTPRSAPDSARPLPALTPARFARRTLQTWLRLMALAALFAGLLMIVLVPATLFAGFMALISQTLATFVLLGALVLVIWLVMFLSYTPQGMLLNPRPFFHAVADSVRLLQGNLPTSLGLIFVVFLSRQLLSYILLTADSGTWVTAILVLAHAYIATALTVSLFLFYRDRFVAHLRTVQPPSKA